MDAFLTKLESSNADFNITLKNTDIFASEKFN